MQPRVDELVGPCLHADRLVTAQQPHHDVEVGVEQLPRVGGVQAEHPPPPARVAVLQLTAMRLVLASASPARLAVLRAAGVDPLVRVSQVDEDAVIAEHPGAPPVELVTTLAEAKARAVLAGVAAELADPVVVGCDSMLHVDGELVGKPGTAQAAAARWRRLAGNSGELLTGHAVLRVDGRVARGAQATRVRFGCPSQAELDAYLASGEPLQVAGGFTLDGLGGWFVDGVDGDPSSVIGISLPLTRRLLREVGVTVTDLWTGRER
jgi:septum formation protein